MPKKAIVLSHNPTLLAILKNSFFQREGFDLVTVEDAQSCLQIVEAEAPTLVALDLALMDETALSCCRLIKNDPLLKLTPVMLLLPEQAPESLADVCWEAGCDAVVHRPLAEESFLDAACGLLGISRRLSRRFPVNFHLQFQDNTGKVHVGSCVNFNTGGMFLATETLFPVDTRLRVEFVLPGFQEALCCSVRVAWVNHPEWRKKNSLPCGLGLQFVDLSATVKTTLRNVLATLSIVD